MNEVTCVKSEEENKNKWVFMGNKLIESRYSLGVYEQRIVLKVISMIDKEDKDFKPYRFKVLDYKDELDLKNKNVYSHIKKILTGLRQRSIYIPLDNESNRYLVTGWISSAEYLGNGEAEILIDPKLKPYLLGLKGNFTRQSLDVLMRLRGSYDARIYVLLKQYEKIGQRRFTIEKFKYHLDIDKDKYKLYANLKARVINHAKKEFKKKNSDINFILEEERKGVKVVALNFIIIKQEQGDRKVKKLKVESEKKSKNRQLPEFKKMMDILASEEKASDLLEKYPIEYIKEKLQILKERQEFKVIDSPAGFLIKAIKEDWKSKTIEEKKRKEVVAKNKKFKERDKKELEMIESLKSNFMKISKNDFIESMAEEVKKELLREIITKNKGKSFILSEIEKKGLLAPSISRQIIEKISGYYKKRDTFIDQRMKEYRILNQGV